MRVRTLAQAHWDRGSDLDLSSYLAKRAQSQIEVIVALHGCLSLTMRALLLLLLLLLSMHCSNGTDLHVRMQLCRNLL